MYLWPKTEDIKQGVGVNFVVAEDVELNYDKNSDDLIILHLTGLLLGILLIVIFLLLKCKSKFSAEKPKNIVKEEGCINPCSGHQVFLL